MNDEKLPSPLRNLAERLSRLPSIGPRQALRLAFYLVTLGKNTTRGLAEDIRELENIKTCARCFFVHQNDAALCDICRDEKRKKDIIMVVEKETELLSLENTRKYGGTYCIIGSIPKSGLLEEWQKLRLESLKSYIKKELGGEAEEIVLGFNPTRFGDINASIIEKELGQLAKKITRLGRGLPTSGEIEFADDETLGNAVERRQQTK